jgi:adenine-specific DNA-methyltransferase
VSTECPSTAERQRIMSSDMLNIVGPTTRSNQRRIANPRHNSHIAYGIDQHEPTAIAPPSLLRPLPPAVVRSIEARHENIKNILEDTIGPALYCDLGFFLYRGDSSKLLARLADSQLTTDLTVTSPPYNIGKEYEEVVQIEEYVAFCSKWMGLVHQITGTEGAFWLNVGYLEIPDRGLCVPIPYVLWDKSPFYLLQEVVWKYGAGVSTNRRLSPRNEKWLFYVKDPANYTFNLDDIRDPNVKYPNQKRNGKYRCNPLGKNPSDVWEFPKVTTGARRSSKERTGHPAQFPLAVVERIIRASSNPLQLVLDPFAGSCSTGIAAVALGRIFLGIELRQEYCDLSIRRHEMFKKERHQASLQGGLFC